MAVIQLTRGYETVVDDADFAWLNQWSWYAMKNRKNGTVYAARRQRGSEVINGRRDTILMHRQIVGCGDDDDVDHWDKNGLNNRRHNLRPCSESQNAANRGPSKNNTSGYKGVFGHSTGGQWRAQITIEGVKKHLGLFRTAQDAAVAYDKAANDHFGEFARPNFG